MILKNISHYKILEKLGEGGMGVVYKAQDTKLKRTVALKFLTPQALGGEEEKTRFVNEAQAAAALDHSNICTVHEIDEADGQTFIAMAYIDGPNLRERVQAGPLKLDEALDIAIQIACGLQAAHEQGIVHRDIKSANIMLTEKGQAKIMDFGLAKLARGTQLTKTGTTMGTVAYMSPEQTRGKEVDFRTDIWSFGVMLYELITGQLPFKGDYEQAVIYSILNEDPDPMRGVRTEVSTELELIVNKALAKSPDSRYQNAGDILGHLRSLRKELESRETQTILTKDKPSPSIAVLPFTNLSADKEQEYFCDGMAEEIINALTHIEGSRVVARTSAFAFKGKHVDIREIGKKLNVKTVLEGSVRKAGNRLRITAQLVNVADGYHLWSEKYDRDMEDVFAIQDEISLAIVDKLKVKLLRGEKTKLIKRHTEDLDAFNLYLKGHYCWNKRTEEGLEKGIKYFQQAIEKDPNYALAYIGLADSYVVLHGHGFLPPKECFPKAQAAVLKALEIDDTLAEAHASLAQIKYNFENDWERAELEFKRAVALNPGYATAHHWYALFLSRMGRHDEATAKGQRAQELDPLSPIISMALGGLFYYACRYDQAIDQFQKVLEMDRDFVPAHWRLGCSYQQKGMYKEALAELQEAKRLSPEHPVILAYHGYVYAVAGKRGEAQKTLDELKQLSRRRYVPATSMAIVHAGLGEKDQAFEWLGKALQEGEKGLFALQQDPALDPLRTDPRFTALLKKMGLEK